MLKEEKKLSTEELLAKAEKPAEDAMKLHPFYRGKTQTALRAPVRSFDDFAIWYTPGVASPSKKTPIWCMSTPTNGTPWL